MVFHFSTLASNCTFYFPPIDYVFQQQQSGLVLPSETQPPNNRSYNHRLKQKARCRFTRCIHIQSNVMIHIKYINIIPDFSVPGLPLRSPSDQDNLTPFFFLSSLLSHLYWSIRELSQLPSSLPHLIIRAQSPSDANPEIKCYSETSSTLQSPLLKSSVALNTSVIVSNLFWCIGNIF